MQKTEAKNALRAGYYSDEWETDEVYGFLCTHFPEVVDEDKDLEEMIAEACFG